MKEFLKKIESAFDNHSKHGFSARKLTSFAIIVCVVMAHFSWLKHAYTKEDYNLLSEVLFIDYGFIAALLGMTTYSSITEKRLQTNKTENDKEQIS